MKLRKRLCVLLVLVFLFSFTGCNQSVDSTEKERVNETEVVETNVADDEKNVITFGMMSDPQTLNPLVSIDGNAGSWFASMVYPTLLTQDVNADVQPYVAESYSVSEDGKEVTYHLRKDLVWDDGTPFTSADVAYSKYLAGDLQISPIVSTPLSLVESMETPDDYTITFVLSQPSYSFVNSVGIRMDIVPKHIWENLEDPANFLNEENQVGMGPYRLKDFEKGQYYIYESVDEWFLAEDSIPIEELVFRIYPDENAMSLALQNGEIDIIACSISYELIEQLKEKNYSIAETNSLGFTHIGFNLNNEFLSDINIRKAVAMAIDKETVLQFALKNQGSVMDSIISPAFPSLKTDDEETKYPSYDVEGAKQILVSAGYEDTDGDGIVNAPNGKNVSFNVIYIAEDMVISNAVEVVVQSLKEIGIEMVKTPMERTTFIQKRLDTDFDSYLAQWGTMEPLLGDFIINYLSSSPVYFNGVKCDSTEAAILHMESAVSEEDFIDSIKEFEIAMAHDIINVPLYMNKLSYAYNGDVLSNVVAYPSIMNGVTTPEALLNMRVKEK